MKYFIGFAFLILSVSFSLNAQYDDVPSFEDTLMVYEDLFEIEEPLHLTMKFDMKTFKRTRQKEKYQPCEMTCHVTDSFHVTHQVRIKARGIFRRDNCSTPPFWLNIRYAGIETEQLKDVRKLKMVIRCRGSAQYSSYVLREYLTYKIYNIITPHSFKVRLVRLTMVDTGHKDKKSTEDWAFLIEPEELMAKRVTGKIIKSDELSIRTVNREMMDLVAMYQYLIGNGDFSVTGRHNLKILALANPDMAGFVPVPYDFDYTGLVNAHYAIPGETLGIKNVRERYYLGPCRPESVIQLAIDKLFSYREEIKDYIKNFEYLEEKDRLDMISYIESFYNSADNEKFINRHIATTCR
jgi:hypothetical protein